MNSAPSSSSESSSQQSPRRSSETLSPLPSLYSSSNQAFAPFQGIYSSNQRMCDKSESQEIVDMLHLHQNTSIRTTQDAVFYAEPADTQIVNKNNDDNERGSSSDAVEKISMSNNNDNNTTATNEYTNNNNNNNHSSSVSRKTRQNNSDDDTTSDSDSDDSDSDDDDETDDDSRKTMSNDDKKIESSILCDENKKKRGEGYDATLCFLSFLLLGTNSLNSWNIVLNTSPYWSSNFFNGMDWGNSFLAVFQCGSLFSQILLLLIKPIRPNFLLFGCLLNSVVSLLMPAVTTHLHVSSSVGSTHLFCLFLGISSGLMQGIGFTIGGILPKNLVGAVSTGQGLSTLAAFLLGMIFSYGVFSLSTPEGTRGFSWTLFSISSLVSFVTFFFLLISLRRPWALDAIKVAKIEASKRTWRDLFFKRRKTKNETSTNENKNAVVVTMDENTINNNKDNEDEIRTTFQIIRDIYPALLCVVFTFFITLNMYPQMGPINWNYNQKIDNHFLILFGMAAVGEFCGRSLPNISSSLEKCKEQRKKKKRHNKKRKHNRDEKDSGSHKYRNNENSQSDGFTNIHANSKNDEENVKHENGRNESDRLSSSKDNNDKNNECPITIEESAAENYGNRKKNKRDTNNKNKRKNKQKSKNKRNWITRCITIIQSMIMIPPRFLIIFVLLRVVFYIPFILGYKLENTPVVNDMWFYVVMMLLQFLTHGWLVTLSLVYCITTCRYEADKQIAGPLSVISLIIGIVLGLYVSMAYFPMPA